MNRFRPTPRKPMEAIAPLELLGKSGQSFNNAANGNKDSKLSMDLVHLEPYSPNKPKGIKDPLKKKKSKKIVSD